LKGGEKYLETQLGLGLVEEW